MYKCTAPQYLSRVIQIGSRKENSISAEPDITIQLVPLFPQLFKEKQIYLLSTWTDGAEIQTKMARWRWGSYNHLVSKENRECNFSPQQTNLQIQKDNKRTLSCIQADISKIDHRNIGI